MNRSASSGRSWSIRTIVFFWTMRSRVETSAVALPMRNDCPARHPSPKKSPGTHHADYGFFAGGGDHGEPDRAFLDVEDGVCGIALREDPLLALELHDSSRRPRRAQESLEVECWPRLTCHRRGLSRPGRAARNGSRGALAEQG